MNKQTIKDVKANNLLDVLSNESIDSNNIINIYDDLSKVIIIDLINKYWNKCNYILRNIDCQKVTKHREGNDSLLPIRASSFIRFSVDKKIYTNSEISNLLFSRVDDILISVEKRLMSHLTTQLKQILSKTYAVNDNYKRVFESLSELDVTEYFMSKTPEELQKMLSLEYSSNWKWLTFGNDKYITVFIENDDYITYEQDVINEISFVFDNNSLYEISNDLFNKGLYKIKRLQSRRYTDLQKFEDCIKANRICNLKVIND